MNVKITADSTCDLPRELVEKFDIGIVPLIVMKDNQEFIDGVTITPEEIFAHVAAGGSLCSTAARSVGVFEEEFAKYADTYDGILHINIGSGFSSSYQNACIAAKQYSNVRIIDSGSLSSAQGLIVLKAWEYAQTSESMDELKDKVDCFLDHVEGSFVLDRLDYMVKGGRCSGAAALGANLLQLKPCIEIKKGKMTVAKKYRGHIGKCLVSYIQERLEGRTDLDDKILFVTHTEVPEESLKAAKEAIARYGHFENVYDVEAGCTVSCHCGPGTLGILMVRK